MFPYGYGAMMQSQGAYEQSLKDIIEKANGQLQQIQNQPQMPIQQQPSINQTFQLTPNTQSNFRLVNSIDEVQKEIVLADTYFLAKDNSTMWIKNAKGDLRTFELQEIIQKDEKDLIIENLQKQINELKGGINNANEQYARTNDEQSSSELNEPTTTTKSSRVSTSSTSSTTKRKSE